MSTRILLGVKTAGDDLTTFIVPKVKKIRSLDLPETPKATSGL
jgi:hypothetical protein